MEIGAAAQRVLLGEALASIAGDYRRELLESVGLSDEDASETTFLPETKRFVGRLCRHLADRHGEDSRVSAALSEWARRDDSYETFDSLLSTFSRFDGRDALLRRGRALFPRTLTAHWDDP